MNKEFFEALAMLEKEKGIPMQYLIEKIEAAISIAIKRDENGAEDNVVEINPETGRFYVAVRKTVVEEIEDPANEILKAEAAKYNKTAAVGDIIEIPLETKDFGRIAAQAAKHVIRQGIREAERERIMQEYQSHCNDIITATVLRTDAKTGNVTLVAQWSYIDQGSSSGSSFVSLFIPMMPSTIFFSFSRETLSSVIPYTFFP